MGAIIGNLVKFAIGEAIKNQLTGTITKQPPKGKGIIQSKTGWGVFILVAPAIGKALGWEFGEADWQAFFEAGSAIVGGLLAIYGRVKATKKIG